MYALSYGDAEGPAMMTLKYRKLSEYGVALMPGAAKKSRHQMHWDLDITTRPGSLSSLWVSFTMRRGRSSGFRDAIDAGVEQTLEGRQSVVLIHTTRVKRGGETGVGERAR